MAPVPALRDELFEEYDRHNGPLKFEKKGSPSLYVISEEDLSENEPHYSVEDLADIEAGLEDLKNGRMQNAYDALNEIRAQYGI